MKQYLPREAEQLLLDPTWTRFACNYRTNPQFLHADARTRDYRGHRVIDDVMALVPLRPPMAICGGLSGTVVREGPCSWIP